MGKLRSLLFYPKQLVKSFFGNLFYNLNIEISNLNISSFNMLFSIYDMTVSYAKRALQKFYLLIPLKSWWHYGRETALVILLCSRVNKSTVCYVHSICEMRGICPFVHLLLQGEKWYQPWGFSLSPLFFLNQCVSEVLFMCS